MPAWAGALTAVGGGLAAYGAAPSGFSLPKYGPKAATFLPQIFAFLQAGGDINQLMARKVKRKGGGGGGGGTNVPLAVATQGASLLAGGGGGSTNKYKPGYYLADGTKVSRADTIKMGKNRVLISGDYARGVLEKQFQVAQQKQIDQVQKNYNLLFGEQGPPVLKELISDRPAQIREAYGPAANKMLQAVLGGAAPKGTLTTDAVLKRASAPVALQFESLFQQAQDVSNAQKLGLSGVPGFGVGFSADPQNFLSPQSLPSLQNLGLQAFGQGVYSPGYASAISRQQSQGYLSGLYGGLGGGGSDSFFGMAK